MRRMTWKELFSNRRELIISVITIIVALFTVSSYTQFLAAVEQRVGMIFIDPIHNVVGPYDLTWPIFIVLYGALVGALIITLKTPLLFFRIVRAYTILIAIRLVAMWLLPLDPPLTMITLADPFVELFASNGGAPLTRDLFFSGHTSIMVMIGLMLPQRWMRILYLTLAAFIGVAVTLQHVHYSVDVVVAPLAAITAVYLVDGFGSKLRST